MSTSTVQNIQTLEKRLKSKIEDGDITVVPIPIIEENLKFEPRPYQKEAFTVFDYYMQNPKLRAMPTHLLYHMATGSGKTLVMAGNILQLYKMGYRNFIFFVSTDTIIRKTKENFLNPKSSKYLFKDKINIEGVNVNITEVDNFESTNPEDISILFSTIQGLHSRLNAPRENSITFDDFQDKKVVLIGDEAHHINSLTKKKLAKSEAEQESTWEYTVNRILGSNIRNILLEFTATLELFHPAISSKYADKLLYDYSLAKFREDGYSKEVKTNQIDYKPIERALVAVVISQFKKKIFATHGIIAKPVVMLKSKTTAESAEMEEAFKDEIRNLTAERLNKLIQLDDEVLNDAVKYFKELNLTIENVVDEIKDDFSEEKVISVNSKNDSDEKQIVINTLEDKDNLYRAIFAVDKLNEGWDVLNLFDIVRLYDTRDAAGNKPGKTTVAEAQLIGRGARYYPFRLNPEQDLDKRKYDYDEDNILRYCETLHYHCSHNPRYIQELTAALRQIGLFPEERKDIELRLKEDFKNSKYYRSGFIFVNKKVRNEPKALLEYQEPTIRKKHEFKFRTYRSGSTTLLDTESVKKNKVQGNWVQKHYLSIWDKTIILKGLNKIPFYHFSNIKRLFPSVNSMNEFIQKDEYFGGIVVEVSGMQKDVAELTREQKLEVVIKVASDIADEINTTFGDYRGTKLFYREPLRKFFKNRKMQLSVNTNPTAETGKPTMRPDIDPKYFVDLNKADWYVYEENYGTSEEKLFVKYIHDNIDELRDKYKDIYVLRNERAFKIFRFSDGKATEPDYVLFLTDKFTDKELVYQFFVEPKGSHLLYNDSWKEEFLESIEDNAIFEVYEDKEYKLIGLPFYNKEFKEAEFDEVLKGKLDI